MRRESDGRERTWREESEEDIADVRDYPGQTCQNFFAAHVKLNDVLSQDISKVRLLYNKRHETFLVDWIIGSYYGFT